MEAAMKTQLWPAEAGALSPSRSDASRRESARPGTAPGSFADALARVVDAAKAASGAANESILRMLDKSGDVHDAMIALNRAELSLQFTVQVRNKLVQAYQEIMRMSI
jgi:flagellar hook-basal body complex protein FliE